MTLRVAAEGMLPALYPFLCSQDSHSERGQAVSLAKSWRRLTCASGGDICMLSVFVSGVRL